MVAVVVAHDDYVEVVAVAAAVVAVAAAAAAAADDGDDADGRCDAHCDDGAGEPDADAAAVADDGGGVGDYDDNCCTDSGSELFGSLVDHAGGFRKTSLYCYCWCVVRSGSVDATTQSHSNGSQPEGHSQRIRFPPASTRCRS
uniref:Putative secreted peptide n=1 Tax=Anopheles braziliensis TaxID=58242 RepID=A0A2M3ZNN8_9DIPT